MKCKTYYTLFSILLIGILYTSAASAFEFDNVGKIDKTKGEFGKITVDNAFGLGKTLITHEILSHTDQCLINCKTTGVSNVYDEGSLFTDLEFIDKYGDKNNVLYENIRLWQLENVTNYYPVYNKSVCSNIDKNGTSVKECSKDIGGYEAKKEKKIVNEITNYKGESLKEGTYYWEITANKRPFIPLDWGAKTRGIDLKQYWAWYNNNWSNYITFTPSNTTMPYGDNQGYVHLITINTSMISGFSYADTNSTTNGSDIIFVEGTHDNPNLTVGELRYYNIIWNITGNSIFGVVTNSSTVTNITMYYNNTRHVTTSNLTATFKTFSEPCDNTNGWTAAGMMTTSGGICSWIHDADNEVSNTTKSFRMSNLTILASLDWTDSPGVNTKMIGFANGIGDPWGETQNLQWKHRNDPADASYNPSLRFGEAGVGETQANMSQVVNPSSSVYGKYLNFMFKVNDSAFSYSNIDRAIGSFAQRTSNAYKGISKSIAITATGGSGTLKADWLAVANWSLSEPTWTPVAQGTAAAPPTVTLNNPANNNVTNLTQVLINCSATDDVQVRNITRWINGADNKTATINAASGNLTDTVTFADGVYSWTCSATDDLNLLGWASSNRTLTIDTTKPQITITSPTGEQSGTSLPYNVTLNATSSDTNLQACYQNSTVNSTITIYTCNTTSILTVTTGGSHTVTFCANDTAGNLACNTSTFYKLIAENNFTYNASIYETDRGYFKINLSTFMGTSTVDATLWYNGTGYSSDSALCSGNECIAYRTLDIPSLQNITNATRIFYWNLTITNSTSSVNITSSTQQHTVNPIYLNYCGTVANATTLNFTVRDELNNSLLNSTFQGTYRYWIGGGGATRNYSYSDTTNTAYNYPFCIYPPNRTFFTDLDAGYTAPGYSDRQYFLNNASINNVSNNIILYLLNSVDYQKFFIAVKQGISEVENAIVTIKKFDVGTGQYVTIGVRETDIDGEFIEYLDLDKDYQYIVVSSTGTVLGVVEKRATCQAAPCELTLQLDESAINGFETYYNTFAGNIVYNLSYNSTSKLVKFTYIDTTGLATYARLQVDEQQINESVNTVCDSSVFSVSGTITCNMTGYEGEFKASSYISRSPEKLIDYIRFLVENLTDELGTTGLFIDILFLCVIFFAFAYNPVVGVLSVPISLIITKLAGTLPITWTPISIIAIIAIWLAARMSD